MESLKKYLNKIVRKLGFSTLVFLFLVFSSSFVQSERLDFSARWDTDSAKNIIIVNITKGSNPVNCCVYDSSPFTGGQLIKQIDKISHKKFEIELEKRVDVYVCIYTDENNLAAKWVRINRDIK